MAKPLILITGASGRIGRAVALAFAKQYQIVGLDVVASDQLSKDVDFRKVNLSDPKDVSSVLSSVKENYGAQIASVIHLAAYYSFSDRDWEGYQRITVDGTSHLLDALEMFSIEQFLFSSTMLVHAPCKKGEKIDEHSPVVPKWEYPLSKAKTEELIRAKKGKMSSVILRISGIYDDDCNSIPISQHILRIYRKELESHFFPGNVHHGAPFLHMDDLIDAIMRIVEKRAESGEEEVFLLGEPDLMTFLDLQREIGILVHGKPWWTIRIPKWFAKIGAHIKKTIPFLPESFIQPWMIDLADDHYDLCIDKAHNQLGWVPRHKLKENLPIMVEKLKQNPKNWIAKHKI